MALSVPDQLSQLNVARQMSLADPALYPQIVSGILPIIGANARIELRRWGAEFLAETFSSPVIAAKMKEQMAISALQTLKEMLETPAGDDTVLVKGSVQASASIYALIFKYIIENPIDVPVWNNMATIKSNILRRWDSTATGVKICCIKFVQRVVEVQTPGAIADPRRPEKNETSIALVPRDHPLIPPSKLEPEASGLLDRLLDVFHEDPSDAVLVDATLNCVGVLLRSRPAIADRITSAILNFNPLKRANSPMTPKARVQIKSMERTTRALLMNIYRRNDKSPLASRIKAYVERMNQTRMEIFDEGASKKRGLPAEPTDGLDSGKRRRLAAEIPEPQGVKLLSPGPNPLGHLYTLGDPSSTEMFDVQTIPPNLAIKITQGLLTFIDQQKLDKAIDDVRSRLLALQKVPEPALGDDEEDYEPNFEPNEDREQILNRADALPPEEVQPEVKLGPFQLPQPPLLTQRELESVGKGTIGRVFGMIKVLDEPSTAKKRKQGLNRLAGSSYDREAWVTFITRLATRASSGLIDVEEEAEDTKALIKSQNGRFDLSDTIRDNLWRYIIEDFRARIHIAIAWLNEEWFNDKMHQQAYDERKFRDRSELAPRQHYEKWVLKVLDAITPYLDAKDKLLIRFLSEIPVVSEQVLQRVKNLAQDPERVDLAVKAIHYLILLKPPARDICIDAVEDLWRNYDAKGPTTKLLQKWRPGVLPPPPPKPSQAAEIPKAEPPSAHAIDSRSQPQSNMAIAANSDEMKSPTTGLPVAAAG